MAERIECTATFGGLLPVILARYFEARKHQVVTSSREKDPKNVVRGGEKRVIERGKDGSTN